MQLQTHRAGQAGPKSKTQIQDRLKGKEGSGGLSAFRLSAVSELSEPLHPPGETAPQPGAVNHLHGGQATVKLQPAVVEAPRLDPEMCRLSSSPRHQQSPSRTQLERNRSQLSSGTAGVG